MAKVFLYKFLVWNVYKSQTLDTNHFLGWGSAAEKYYQYTLYKVHWNPPSTHPPHPTTPVESSSISFIVLCLNYCSWILKYTFFRCLFAFQTTILVQKYFYHKSKEDAQSYIYIYIYIYIYVCYQYLHVWDKKDIKHR